MYRLIIVGSPNAQGRSASLAYELFESCIDECPDDVVKMVSVASLRIEGCIGCNGCAALAKKAQAEQTNKAPSGGAQGAGVASCTFQGARDASVAAQSGKKTADSRLCVIDDDMDEVYDALRVADEVIIVAPVYFAGPTSQFKALLDRLQPFFWTDARRKELKPATLHVIGEGHDPFGYDPLVTCVQSALYCAGFELRAMFDWVGCISVDGEIVQDAQQYALYMEEADGREDAANREDTAVGTGEPQKSQGGVKLDLSLDKGGKSKYGAESGAATGTNSSAAHFDSGKAKSHTGQSGKAKSHANHSDKAQATHSDKLPAKKKAR